MATSEREAIGHAEHAVLFPLHIAPAKSVRRGGGKPSSSRNLTTFYAQLADLLHSGVPLLRSLDLLRTSQFAGGLSEVCVRFAPTSPTVWSVRSDGPASARLQRTGR